MQSQTLAALAFDPLGVGWNLFGTAGFEPNIGLVDARATWRIAVAAIVIGHGHADFSKTASQDAIQTREAVPAP